MNLALASVKGSPGVTTAVLALAHVWPTQRRLVVVDCDPSGGDIARNLGLDPNGGLLALAADPPRAASAAVVEEHLQEAGGVLVLTCPSSGTLTRNALQLVAHGLARSLGDLSDTDVLVDCGRLYADSPSLVLATAAHRLMLVVRPTAAELGRVADDARGGLTSAASPALVLVGTPSRRSGTYPADEVESTLGVPVVATLDDDRRGARRLVEGGDRRLLDRSALIASARRLATALVRASPADHPGTVAAGFGPGDARIPGAQSNGQIA